MIPDDNIPQSSSDELWIGVMNYALKISPETQKDKWRIVENSCTACMKCNEAGGKVLLRCGGDNCKCEYHLDCAYHDGGLSLDASRLLTTFCNDHYTSYLFCSCKEKYDESKPMIYCDECCDWFHYTCEGLNMNAASQLDRYTCKKCKDLMKRGKSVSQETKELNYANEQGSSKQLTAEKAVQLLMQITSSICPLIDELRGLDSRQESQQQCYMMNSQKPMIYSSEEIKDGLEALSSPPITSAGSAAAGVSESDNSDENNGNGNGNGEDYIAQTGVRNIIDGWRVFLADYLRKYNSWLVEAKNVYANIVSELQLEVSAEQRAAVEKVHAELLQLRATADSSQLGGRPPEDMRGFDVFVDAVEWILTFLQELHVEQKPDRWIHSLTTQLRGAGSKARELVIQGKESFFCRSFTAFFQGYVKVATQMVSSINSWCSKAADILDQDMMYSLSDLEAFLLSADELPTKPLHYAALSDLIKQAREVQDQVQQVLAQTTVDEPALEALIHQKNELGVAMSGLDQSLLAVRGRLVFLKARNMALQGEGSHRLSANVAASLVADAQDLLRHARRGAGAGSGSGSGSLLIDQLDSEVRVARDDLQDLLRQAAERTRELDPHVLAGNGPYQAEIDKLQGLKILTPEEELLLFLKNSDSLQNEIVHFQPTEEQPAHPEEVQRLIQRIEDSMEQEVVDRFEVALRHKGALKMHRSALLDMKLTAERSWSIVGDLVAECVAAPATAAAADAESGPDAAGTAISPDKAAGTSTTTTATSTTTTATTIAPVAITTDLLTKDDFVTREELQQAVDGARRSCVRDEDTLSRAQELLQEAQSAAEECVQQLSDVKDASAESVARAKQLLRRMKRYPVPALLLQQARRRYEVCQTVHTSINLLHGAKLREQEQQDGQQDLSSSTYSEKDIAALRGVAQAIKRLDQTVPTTAAASTTTVTSALGTLDATEAALMDTVRAAVLLLHWKQEVLFVWAHSAPLLHAEEILRSGELMGEPATSSPEWAELLAEVTTAREFAAAAQSVLADLQAAMVAADTALERKEQEQEQEQISSGHGDADSITAAMQSSALEEAGSAWTAAAGPVAEKLSNLLTRGEQSRIRQPALFQQLQDGLHQIQLLGRVIEKYTAVKRVLASAPPDLATALTAGCSETVPSVSIFFTHDRVMDIQELTAFANQLASTRRGAGISSAGGSGGAGASGGSGGRFQLQEELLDAMQDLHQAVGAWSARAVTLLPAKSTRTKTKQADTKTSTKEDVCRALLLPIARAIATPASEKLLAVLEDAARFRIQLAAFIMSDDHDSQRLKEKGQQDSGSMYISGEGADADNVSNLYGEQFQAQLDRDLRTLQQLRDEVDLLPIDLDEARVLHWIQAVFEWINAIPYPGESATDSSISLEYAQRKLEEAHAIISDIPQLVIDSLEDMGAVNLDESRGPVGFHRTTHPNLHRAAELSDHLETQVDRTKELQLRVSQAVANELSLEELVDLSDDCQELLVQVSPNVRKMLDKAITQLQREREREEAATAQQQQQKSTGKRGAKKKQKMTSSKDAADAAYEEDGDDDDDDDDDDDAAAAASSSSAGMYWKATSPEEREKQKQAHKRVREAADSLLSAPGGSSGRRSPSSPASAMGDGADALARKKGSGAAAFSRVCMNPSCQKSYSCARPSQYCTYRCASKVAPKLLKALLRYRSLMCFFGTARRRFGWEPSAEEQLVQLNQVALSDWLAFMRSDLPQLDVHRGIADITTAIKNAGFVAEPTATGPGAGTGGRVGDSSSTSIGADKLHRLLLSDELLHPLAPSSSGDQSIDGGRNIASTGNSSAYLNPSERSGHSAHSLLHSSTAATATAASNSSSTASSSSPRGPGGRGASGAVAAGVAASHGADKKLTMVQALLSSLPPAAGPVLLRGDAEQLAHHAAALTAAGAVPVPISAGPGTTNTGAASLEEEMRLKVRYLLEELFAVTLTRQRQSGAACKAAFLAMDVEEELCRKYTVTTTTSSGAGGSGSSKKLISKTELEKKEYRKHFTTLISNLKRPHNDPLVLKLVHNEVTCAGLLEISTKQLADPSRQQQRQEQLEHARQDSVRVSTEDAMAARRAQMLAGKESGDSGGATAAVTAAAAAGGVRLEASGRSNMGEGEGEGGGGSGPADQGIIHLASSSGDSVGSGSLDDIDAQDDSSAMDIEALVQHDTALHTGSGPRSGNGSPRSSSSPRSGSGHGSFEDGNRPKPKRPLDVDAGDRFTSASRKLQKLDTPGPPSTSTSTKASPHNIPAAAAAAGSVPLKAPPALLGSLKAAAVGKGGDSSSSKHHSHSAVHMDESSSSAASRHLLPSHHHHSSHDHHDHHDHHSSSSATESAGDSNRHSAAQLLSQVTKMVNSSGGFTVKVTHPITGGFTTEGWLFDRRLQGVIPAAISIDGRVKLDEFKRSTHAVEKVLRDPKAPADKRKFLATFKFTVPGVARGDAVETKAYHRFCEEFTKNQRIGFWQDKKDGVMVYLSPPALKHCNPVFDCFSIKQEAVAGAGGGAPGILYGVLISKHLGPSRYHDAELLPETSASTLNKPESSLPSGSSSSSSSGRSGSGVPAGAGVPPPPLPPKVPRVPAPLPPKPPSSAGLHAAPPGPTPVPAFHSATTPMTAAGNAPMVGGGGGGGGAFASAAYTAPVAPSVAATGSGGGGAEKGSILKVAQFCVQKGVQTISHLKEKPESRTLMPFLFEDHPDYPAFIQQLKVLVEQDKLLKQQQHQQQQQSQQFR